MDRHAAERFSVKRAEVGLVSGDEHVASQGDGSGEYGAILLRHLERSLRHRLGNLNASHLDAREQVIERFQAIGRLRQEVAARLFGDVHVRPAFVPFLEQELEQTPDRAVGFRGGEEDVRVEKDSQARPQRSFLFRGRTFSSSASASSNSWIRALL